MSADAITVARELVEAEYPEWDALIERSEEGSVYQLSSYLRTLCKATGGSFSVIGVFEGNRLVGGAPLYSDSANGGVGNRLLLYYNGYAIDPPPHAGPTSQGENHCRRLATLAQALHQLPVRSIVLNCFCRNIDLRPFLALGWRVTPSYTYLVPLHGEVPLWDRLDKNVRRLIRKAEAAGVRFEQGISMNEFYNLHFELHQTRGAPLYLSREGFTRYMQELEQSNLGRGYSLFSSEGRLLAAQIVVAGPLRLTHTVCAVTAEEGRALGAAPCLRWKVFQQLAAEGYALNDLTDAALNSVSKFKSQLASELKMNFVLERPRTAGGELLYATNRYIRSLLSPLKHALFSRAQRPPQDAS